MFEIVDVALGVSLIAIGISLWGLWSVTQAKKALNEYAASSKGHEAHLFKTQWAEGEGAHCSTVRRED